MERRGFLPAALLAAAGCAAYLNSFSAPFLFDDFYHIVYNPRIRDSLHSFQFLTGTTRPLVAFTLAVNYALSGLNVWGYHAFNLAIHLAAGLTLLGILRRTLKGPEAEDLALVASLIWLIHPLQTESVTYLIQRGESLMGLFYLLTLYCVIRGRPGWAILCCALGMLTKPVMVTAPVIVLIYARIFLAPSWKELLRRNGWLYAGLFATWAILPLTLSQGTQEYAGLVGMDLKKVSPLGYLLTQPGVILHYLRLSFWPHPLLLDTQWPTAKTFVEIVPPVAAVASLLVLTLWALRRRPEIGFLGVWFFGILAPTSSFLPIVDAAFEHRIYLPLAAVAVGVVLAARRLCGRRKTLFQVILFAGVLALSLATVRRNAVYSDPVSFWQEHLSHRPGNARALVNLGAALQQQGRSDEAEEAFKSALKFRPDLADAHNNLAYLLLLKGNLEEAFARYREALRLAPDSAMARKGMGMTLHRMGRLEEAAAEYEQALRLNPVFGDARVQLGLIRQTQGRYPEAFRQYREALRLNPKEAAAWNNIGTLLFQQGKWREAAPFFRQASELDPDYTEARDNLRKTLVLLENNFTGP